MPYFGCLITTLSAFSKSVGFRDATEFGRKKGMNKEDIRLVQLHQASYDG